MSKEMRNMINNFKKLLIENNLLIEAKFEDVAVWPAKGMQRGTSESSGKSFDIMIGNPDVIRKMAKTPMGSPGKMKSFKYEGPEGDVYKEFEWNADTSQWDVWKNMNYIILTPDNHTHWYHGKIPGGTYKDDAGNLITSSTGLPLPELTIKRFGYKVYKALLLDPNVGYIKSDKSSTPEIKRAVFSKLIQDNDFVWITTNGDTVETYDDIVIINPNYDDVQKVRQEFESEHEDSKFYYSKNFPKQNPD